MARVLLWDTENSSLNADFGSMLCFGYKWLGERGVTVKSVSDFPKFKVDPTDDGPLVQEAYKVLSSADVWVTWYGIRYDVPFVATRLLDHRKEFSQTILPPVPHVDGWEIARKKLRLHSNRLASVSGFLGLSEKTPIKPTVWRRALSGHKDSLKYIIAHCKRDVVVLEEVYKVIRPLLACHPNLAMLDGRPGCAVCKGELQRRGTIVTAKKIWKRYQCQRCGAWSRG